VATCPHPSQMKKEYKKVGDNLVITIPLKKRRTNPYDDDGEEMDNIIGLYEDENDNGLTFRIDMAYKGKDDQYTDYFFKLDGDKEEFIAMCKELGIGWVELPPTKQ